MTDTVFHTLSQSEHSSALGWIVSLIVILTVIVAGFVWVRRDVGIPNTGSDTNIHAEVPSTDTSAETRTR